jgi:Lon protease-like protein
MLHKSFQKIDTKTFNTHEEILAFEEQEQQDFATVKKEKQEKLNELMEIIHANEYKEAELNQKQKELRAAITERSKELSFVAQFLDLEEQRTNELHDAQRTLEILQKQMERLQMDLDARKREYSISEAERRAAEENHIHTPSSATISIPPSPR